MFFAIAAIAAIALSCPAPSANAQPAGGKFLYSEQELFSPGERRTYEGEHLRAISFPVGGVGAGAVHVDGRGVRHTWAIFGERWDAVDVPGKEPIYITRSRTNDGYEPLDEPKPAATYMAYVPDSFFAVRAKPRGGEAVVRALQTVDEGPFKAMKSLAFSGEYPFAWLTFADDQLPVRAAMETFSPLIPLNVKESGIPAAIYKVTVENLQDVPVEVSVLATQQNAVGYTGGRRSIRGRRSGGSGRNINKVVRGEDAVTIHMSSDLPEDRAGYGDMALSALDAGADAVASWDTLDALHRAFAGSGRLEGESEAGPTPDGETLNGAIASRFTLAPGGKRTVTFVLSWHFPNARHGHPEPGERNWDHWGGAWYGHGNQYANWWPSARGVASYVVDNLQRLDRQTRCYHESLYRTNLPRYMVDRISSQVAPLRTRTVWWDGSGYFGGWEGMSAGGGSCPGNSMHVWHYAQAYARLFPELGRILREQEFRFQREGGYLPYRQAVVAGSTGRCSFPATDGMFGAILGVYREYTTSPDDRWMRRQWPRVRQAMEFAIATWDPKHKGELSGFQHNTLDGKVTGSTAWLGSMYIAALRASERMAQRVGDSDAAARYAALHAGGSRIQSESLFNDQYYQQVLEEGEPDNWYARHGYEVRLHPAWAVGENYANGSHVDQLLGQWWADQVNLGTIYNRDDQKVALRNLFRNNFILDFTGRNWPLWVVDCDPGLVNCTWPEDRDPQLQGRRLLGYHQCVLTGFEYAAAAAMIEARLLQEGFTVVKAVADRHDGRLREPLHRSAWEYGGNPFGDDESGKFYSRAQSSWSLLLAAQGFIYEGPAGVIGFDPAWKPDDHSSFFTAAQGYGVFEQKRKQNVQTCTIDMRDGLLNVRRIVLHIPETASLSLATIEAAGRAIPAQIEAQGRRIELALAEPLELAGGQSMVITLNW